MRETHDNGVVGWRTPEGGEDSVGTGDSASEGEHGDRGENDAADGTLRRRPALIATGAVVAVAAVAGLLAVFGAFDTDDDPRCSIDLAAGAAYAGPARNTTGGFDGVAMIDVTAVDTEACTVSLDIAWTDGLSGRGQAVTGVLDEQGAGELVGTFVWEDGPYDLSIGAAELTAAVARGTYDITAREDGPTVAVGTGTFETVAVDPPP